MECTPSKMPASGAALALAEAAAAAGTCGAWACGGEREEKEEGAAILLDTTVPGARAPLDVGGG